MAQHLNSTSDSEINSAIQVLERRDLDLVPVIDLSSYAARRTAAPWSGAKFEFLRVKGIARSIAENKADVERFMMEDVLAGLHGLGNPLIYLVIGSRLDVRIYLGILNKSVPKPTPSFFLDVLASSLQSTFPDIDLEYLAGDAVDVQITEFFKKCRHFGVMTGIPTAKLGVEEQGIEQIERLIRGLYRQEFGYMVIADPVGDEEVVEAFDDITQIIKEKSSLVKETRQYTQTSRLTMNGETLNRSVQYFIELLEVLLEKLKVSKAQGMWRTMSYFFSPDPATAGRMGSLLKTVFSGDKSVPEAIRTVILNGATPSTILSQFKQIELELNFHPAYSADHPLRKVLKHQLVAALSTRDLATLSHLPKEEMPGYDVKDTARFGVCLPETRPSERLFVGEITDRGMGTGNFFSVPVRDLVKHGLVAGVTGSGKTNTCLCLLDQLWKGASKTPFLVIEPAKGEYRSLLNVKDYEDLLIFTLGDELTSPFRLNPFEIMDGVKLQTHIDNLRAVFNASFVMYAPMPQVLERCIHEIYKDKGWDLTTNRNRFAESGESVTHRLFPTLSDLYEKIGPVVDSLGYEDRLTMDIKAALQARIGSLRIGGKGSMLDTALSIPIGDLLSTPTVLELQSIGDDEEKAFIMAILLARLYEYRDVEARRAGTNTGLKHVTLVEEAHRLLTRTSTDFSNQETANPKGKAVESFCNMLSEIRAFGEGMLIAEQIPVKLAQDAIKNTNLKIMHRIVAKDDRDLMGSAMNLNEKQIGYVSIMDRGEAVVFSEGFSEPFLVKAPSYPASVQSVNPKMTSVQEKDINRFMARKTSALKRVLGRHDGCRSCAHKCVYREACEYLLSRPDKDLLFKRYMLAVLERPENLTSQYNFLRDGIVSDVKDVFARDDETNDVMFCFLVNAGERLLTKRCNQFGLSFDVRTALVTAYHDLINSYFAIPVKTQVSKETEVLLRGFLTQHRTAFTTSRGPFPGCDEFCKYKCLFRYEVEPLVKDTSIAEEFRRTVWSAQETGVKSGLKEYCIKVVQDLTSSNTTGFVENMALCFFIQKSVQESVKKVLNNVKSWFFGMKEVS